MKKINKKAKVAIIIISVFLVVVLGGFYIYTLDYYRADQAAKDIIGSGDNISKDGNVTVFYPEEQTNIGLIFYPGGKVEADAYAPLLKELSNNGITCVLVKMPFNLAVFNINAADDIYDEFPEISDWYICGHSLGGAMASSYVGDNSDKVDGLILFGAYPVNDSSLPTLAIYGSEDIKLDLTKLADVQNKLEIAGGNHAYFGNYGEQEGDGTATITREEQQEQTVDAIINFANNY